MTDLRHLGAICLFMAVTVPALADDDSQTELRLNPVIEANSASDLSLDSYTFLKPEHNRIALNGSDWSEAAARFDAARKGERLFSIVYLGDSHVQADVNVAAMRGDMSAYAPLAGRGLIIPFKLAATNQPLDYTWRTTAPYVTSKLMKQPWPVEMPFTGVGLHPEAHSYSLDISCDSPFSRLRFLHRGPAPAVKGISSENDEPVDYRCDSLGISLPDRYNALRLDIEGGAATVIGGIELMADSVGLVIHSIGNNGATYSSYGLIDGFGSQLARLSPDIIVVDLGTNEAFGSKSADSIENDIDNLVSTLKRHNADAVIVLVSPASCYKKVYRRYKNKKGRWRRTSSKVENAKVCTVADVISRYAKRNNIAFYDRYALAGGAGAAKGMQEAGLLGRDGVHFTRAGYTLWGRLYAKALADALTTKKLAVPEKF